MNRRGLGARALNVELPAALKPPGEQQVGKFGSTCKPWRQGMQAVNDYDRDPFNGDLGVISRVDLEEAALSVGFDGREVTRVSSASPCRRRPF